MPDGQPDKAFGRNGVLVTELPAFSLLSTLLPLGDGTVILGGKGYTSESDTHSDILLLRYLAGLNAGHLCPAHQFPFLDVYPYPVSAGEFQLTYDLPAQNNVIITLRDPGGKELATLLEVCHPEGSHTETLVFPEGLPPGTYLLHVKTEQVEAQMLILH